MALTVKVGKKAEESDELPQDDIDDEEVIGDEVDSDKERLHKLELENAEQRGRLSVLQKAQPDPRSSHEQTKLAVFSDANNLTDEQFQTKYKMEKHLATAAVLERENTMSRQETKMELAEARASAEISSKIGSDYWRVKDEVEATLADLSPEVRQDPKRLAKHMERTAKALLTEHKPSPKLNSVKSEEHRRKLTPDFEKPTPEQEAAKRAEEQGKDEIVEADRPLASAVGLRSESERMKYAAMGDFVPMDLGGGVVFRDPAKGFERPEPASAAKK